MLAVLLFVIAFVLVFFSCEIKTSTVRLSVIGIADAIHARIKKGQWPKYWISYKSKTRREKPVRKAHVQIPSVNPEEISLLERELLRQQSLYRSEGLRRQTAETEDTKPTNL